ncbi:MAG: DUF1588 domain-containing protein [Myxococcota bacterium]
MLFFLLACSEPPVVEPPNVPEVVGAATPLQRLMRASLALREHPPTPEEVRRVHDGADWRAEVRAWRPDPALAEVVADLMGEALGVRHDAKTHVPSLGPLASVPPATVIERLDDAPLRLIAHIVQTEQPFTAIVTTPEVLADRVVSRAFGPPVNESDPGWQVSRWTDGRPAAGVLSSSSLMQRHPIAPTNHQRSRAAIVAEAFLCDDFSQRPEAGTVQPTQQDDALQNDPACQSCHASLDPLAANFEGFRRYILDGEVRDGYRTDCREGFCYPLELYDPALTLPDGVLPAPGYYGRGTSGLGSLGEAIAQDPRFATCMVQRFFGYLVGLDWADVQGDFVQDLAEDFRTRGHDAKALLLAIATHEAFAPESPHAPPSLLRPRQWVRTLDHLVQVPFTALPNPGFGTVDLVTTDRFGLNQGMGGVEGWRLVPPDRGPLPSRELGWRWLAEEAAATVLRREFEGPRSWFAQGFDTSGASARAQLVDWHLRILAEVVEPDDPQIDADLALLETLAHDRAPETAWAWLLSAFLQHPRLVVQ